MPAIPLGAAVLILLSVAAPVRGDNWSGSVRSKVQTDNRYDKHGDYTGEIWTQLAYVNPERQFSARISTVGRFSTDIYRNKEVIYQAFLEKDFAALPLTLRGGRFERSDSLGLYLLDGASADYRFESMPVTVGLYGGRPVRIDHVRSVQGSLVAGAEGLLKLRPQWLDAGSWARINDLDIRMGFQVVQRDAEQAVYYPVQQNPEITGSQFDAVEGDAAANARTQNVTQSTYRLSSTARMAGYLLAPDKPMELFVQGTYAADKNRLEDFFLDGWWDALKSVRLRSYYEAYRPRQPFVTFRDRFYSAYALGEQQVWRGSAQYTQNGNLSYSLGLQYASRDQGYQGHGFNAAVSYRWQPALMLKGEFDYLHLDNGEQATAVYLSASHALNVKTRVAVNLAWRQEDKLLYGQNQARGIESEWQYMFTNSLILGFKGHYIDNTAIPDEYLAAMQLTYYFDRFQPKKP